VTRKEVRTVRRLALAIAAGAVWLFLAALPVLADGGPHVASINSGTSPAGLTADSCAGCHRAHTAQGAMLLTGDEPTMCLLCHGASGTGATTDVESGIQYSAGTATVRGGASVGALRSGGFVKARIASDSPTRLSYQVPAGGSGFTGLVPVAASGADVTSVHMDLSGASSGIAWGNYTAGDVSATPYAGPSVSITCTTCHNPHGNGKYRILNPIPFAAPNTPVGFVPTTAKNVTDAPAVPTGETRNYTNSPALYVSTIPSSYVPDYWRYCTPWNDCSGSNRYEKPNGLTSFRGQISKWCSSCHTRYLAGGGSATYDSTDAIYRYQHTTDLFPGCTQCHVAHGSNAAMAGTYSSSFPYPGGAAPASGSSRLLKIDNRGTCQMCHDPTGSVISSGVQTP
jgi:predicted CXXCH cytochrome family protein